VDKLGTPIAVHGGGTDLIYPHHESELAQAQAAGIVDFVRHWVHVAMVEYQGEKMSKSLGNLVFVHELLQSVPGPAVRILLSQHHYRAAWSYDDEELHSAEDRYRSYLRAMRGGGGVEAKEAVRLRASFLERVDDDLDLPGALQVMDSAVLSVTQVPAATTMSAVGADELLGGMLELLGAGAVPVEA
jgi:L-cysteine:1D-myo-inositol 2-amino-2-deoxy-alpha-D-glucopyranoside ligase